jgi:hypothetical protein
MTESCGACALTCAGRVTHSVRLRSGYRRQSLSLDEPLCREPLETEPPHVPTLPAERRFLSGELCGKIEGLCLALGLPLSLLIARSCYGWRASSALSLFGTGRLGLVLSRTIPFSEPCHPAARAQLVALTPHPPSFHRKFADTDASSSAKPAPTSHATTLPATREEILHRQHATLLYIERERTRARERARAKERGACVERAFVCVHAYAYVAKHPIKERKSRWLFISTSPRLRQFSIAMQGFPLFWGANYFGLLTMTPYDMTRRFNIFLSAVARVGSALM